MWEQANKRSASHAILWCSIVVAVLGMQGTVPSAETTKSVDPIANFQFQGVPLSVSLSEFQRHFPAAVFNSKGSNQKAGLASYVVMAPAKKVADGVIFEFLDGKLFSIQIIYDTARINDQGGPDLFVKRIVETFGITDDVVTEGNRVRMTWQRADINRRLQLTSLPECVGLNITDTAAEAVLNSRKAKMVDLGF